jgi:hyperosmotically inducible protein
MKYLKHISILAAATCGLWAQAPDNTKTNQRDRAKDSVTADQQKVNKSDQETARQIRKAVVADKTLSTYAHNVKIVVQDGRVTLKGPVRSEAERDAVTKIAGNIAGADHVSNEIDIAPEKSAK